MAAQPLGILLGDTSSFSRTHWKSIAVGAVVFGLIMGAFQANLKHTALNNVEKMMGGIENNAGSMKDVMERMQAGDEAAMEEFAKNMEEKGGEMMQQQMMGAVGSLVPMMGTFVLVSMLVTLLGMVYFLLIAVYPEKTTGDLVSSMPKLILPFVGLWIWTFIRSFAWIPFIGVIFAIVLMPRFVAAPLYLLEQKKGVMESVTLSMAATKFYWGKIIGNAIVFGLIAMLVSMVVGLVAGLFIGGTISAFVSAIVSQAIAGVSAVFMVKLARTIMQNPIQA